MISDPRAPPPGPDWDRLMVRLSRDDRPVIGFISRSRGVIVLDCNELFIRRVITPQHQLEYYADDEYQQALSWLRSRGEFGYVDDGRVN